MKIQFQTSDSCYIDLEAAVVEAIAAGQIKASEIQYPTTKSDRIYKTITEKTTIELTPQLQDKNTGIVYSIECGRNEIGRAKLTITSFVPRD